MMVEDDLYQTIALFKRFVRSQPRSRFSCRTFCIEFKVFTLCPLKPHKLIHPLTPKIEILRCHFYHHALPSSSSSPTYHKERHSTPARYASTPKLHNQQILLLSISHLIQIHRNHRQPKSKSSSPDLFARLFRSIINVLLTTPQATQITRAFPLPPLPPGAQENKKSNKKKGGRLRSRQSASRITLQTPPNLASLLQITPPVLIN